MNLYVSFLLFYCFSFKSENLNRSNFMYEKIETPHESFDNYVNIARKGDYNYGMGSFGF